MPYLGNSPTSNFASVTKDTFSGNASTTAFTLSKPATTNGVAVYVENVRQIPTTAYSVSGTTLTFTGTPPSGTNNIYVMHHNTPVSTATHPAAQDLTATNANFTGNVTGAGIDLLLSATISSAVSAYDIDSTYINSTHDNYFIMAEFLPATDNVGMYIRAFVGGTIQDGSIYARETASLAFSGHRSTNSTTSLARVQYYDQGNATGEGISLQGHLQNVNNTARSCCITGQSSGFSNSANQIGASFCGSLLAANASNVVNGLRFYFSSGDIASGSVKLYGIKD